ncbi:MAG: hypothetical protein R2695_10695, partial [Acidimicrobiales bacterium]
FGSTALAIMWEQHRYRYPPDFGWPQQYADLHVYGVVAILLLVVDYGVAAARPDRDERPPPPG